MSLLRSTNLGTPLKNEHDLNATCGNLYGIAKSPSQVGPRAFSPRTEFEGLYLCDASTLIYGVAGMTQSDIDAAKAVLHCRTRYILKQGGSLIFCRQKMERGEKAKEEDEKNF